MEGKGGEGGRRRRRRCEGRWKEGTGETSDGGARKAVYSCFLLLLPRARESRILEKEREKLRRRERASVGPGETGNDGRKRRDLCRRDTGGSAAAVADPLVESP